MRGRIAATLGVVLVVVLAACSSSAKTSTGTPTTTAASNFVPTTTLGTGVTANAIKLGVALPDFKCVENIPGAVDSIRANQQAIYDTYINAINASGGINNRKIDPVYDLFCPIPDATTLAQQCTKLTDDDKVFAVIGNFYDPTGVAQACLAKQHHTPYLGFDLTKQIVEKSPGGYVIFAGSYPERADAVLGQLLKQNNTLQGKTVAILSDSDNKNVAKNTIEPIVKSLGVKTGSTAVLQATSADTTEARAQLDAAIEKWKTEGVDTVWITGENVASTIFVKILKQQMPNVTLVTDVGDTLGFGQGQQKAGANPNPYAGIITVTGLTKQQYLASDNWTYCNNIWKAAHNGQGAPTELQPNPGGLPIDTYGSINDACQLTSLFQQLAAKTGPYLNDNNWVHTVNTYGPIVNRGGGQYASLGVNKYDFDDSFQLASFDPTIPANGDWKPQGALQNITNDG
jgi:ABC-type branched-subunit amino acid transport system substrate-binding protein